MRCLSYCAGILLLALCLPTGAVDDRDAPYLSGYGQAVVDRTFPDLDLRVRAVAGGDGVLLVGKQCLPPAQRAKVAQAVTAVGPIHRLKWQLPCPQPASAPQTRPTALTLLPATEIFAPLVADPREPHLALAMRYHVLHGGDFTAGLVDAGETFSLLEGGSGRKTWQLGIQGGVFSLFDLSTRSNDLLDIDYLIAGFASYRQGAWSYRARYFHHSAHLGDEFLLRNPGTSRENISYEAIDFIASHDWSRFRLYAGGGSAVRTTLGRERGFAQLGGEWRLADWLRDLDLMVAADFQASNEQDWELSQAWEAGLILNRNGRELRFSLQAYDGLSPNGQFLNRDLSYLGLAFQFGI